MRRCAGPQCWEGGPSPGWGWGPDAPGGAAERDCAGADPSICFAGAQADVKPDEVASVLWKYFTELGSNAKETVDQLQQAEITKQLK